MMRRHFPFLCLLILLIVQGCAPSLYQTTTPYPSKQPPTGERDRSQPGTTGPPEQLTAQPKSTLITEISQQAHQQIQNGQLQAAAQTLERGLRIAPKDASLWSQLADIRLRQHLYGQASSLAAKSNSLAGGDVTIIRRNQLIIEEAQKEQK